MAENTTETNTPVTPVVTRDSIRAAVLGKSHQPKSKIVTFFGQKIEVRQPTLGAILEAKDNDDRQAAVVEMLINRCFVPETDIRIFEDADAEQLKTLPFGRDFQDVSNAMEELSDVNFQLQKPGSNGTQPS